MRLTYSGTERKVKMAVIDQGGFFFSYKPKEGRVSQESAKEM